MVIFFPNACLHFLNDNKHFIKPNEHSSAWFNIFKYVDTFFQTHAKYILLNVRHNFLQHAHFFFTLYTHFCLKMSQTHFLKLMNIIEMLHFSIVRNIF